MRRARAASQAAGLLAVCALASLLVAATCQPLGLGLSLGGGPPLAELSATAAASAAIGQSRLEYDVNALKTWPVGLMDESLTCCYFGDECLAGNCDALRESGWTIPSASTSSTQAPANQPGKMWPEEFMDDAMSCCILDDICTVWHCGFLETQGWTIPGQPLAETVTIFDLAGGSYTSCPAMELTLPDGESPVLRGLTHDDFSTALLAAWAGCSSGAICITRHQLTGGLVQTMGVPSLSTLTSPLDIQGVAWINSTHMSLLESGSTPAVHILQVDELFTSALLVTSIPLPPTASSAATLSYNATSMNFLSVMVDGSALITASMDGSTSTQDLNLGANLSVTSAYYTELGDRLFVLTPTSGSAEGSSTILEINSAGDIVDQKEFLSETVQGLTLTGGGAIIFVAQLPNTLLSFSVGECPAARAAFVTALEIAKSAGDPVFPPPATSIPTEEPTITTPAPATAVPTPAPTTATPEPLVTSAPTLPPAVPTPATTAGPFGGWLLGAAGASCSETCEEQMLLCDVDSFVAAAPKTEAGILLLSQQLSLGCGPDNLVADSTVPILDPVTGNCFYVGEDFSDPLCDADVAGVQRLCFCAGGGSFPVTVPTAAPTQAPDPEPTQAAPTLTPLPEPSQGSWYVANTAESCSQTCADRSLLCDSDAFVSAAPKSVADMTLLSESLGLSCGPDNVANVPMFAFGECFYVAEDFSDAQCDVSVAAVQRLCFCVGGGSTPDVVLTSAPTQAPDPELTPEPTLTPLPEPSTGAWHLANTSKSCTQTCEDMSMVCDSDAFVSAAPKSEADMTILSDQLMLGCGPDSIVPDSNYPIFAFGECYYVAEDFSDAQCDASVAAVQRLCFCIGEGSTPDVVLTAAPTQAPDPEPTQAAPTLTPLPEPSQGPWYVANTAESCTQTCADMSMVCDSDAFVSAAPKSEADMTLLSESLGLSCGPDNVANVPMFAFGECFYVAEDFSDAQCDVSVAAVQRLCFCVGEGSTPDVVPTAAPTQAPDPEPTQAAPTLTPLPEPSQGPWYVANTAESCTQTCADKSLLCDSDAFVSAAPKSEADMTLLSESLGLSCGPDNVANVPIFAFGECFYVAEDFSDAQCDVSVAAVQRLCFCVGEGSTPDVVLTAAPTQAPDPEPSMGAWQLGNAAESCTQTCADKSLLCDSDGFISAAPKSEADMTSLSNQLLLGCVLDNMVAGAIVPAIASASGQCFYVAEDFSDPLCDVAVAAVQRLCYCAEGQLAPTDVPTSAPTKAPTPGPLQQSAWFLADPAVTCEARCAVEGRFCNFGEFLTELPTTEQGLQAIADSIEDNLCETFVQGSLPQKFGSSCILASEGGLTASACSFAAPSAQMFCHCSLTPGALPPPASPQPSLSPPPPSPPPPPPLTPAFTQPTAGLSAEQLLPWFLAEEGQSCSVRCAIQQQQCNNAAFNAVKPIDNGILGDIATHLGVVCNLSGPAGQDAPLLFGSECFHSTTNDPSADPCGYVQLGGRIFCHCTASSVFLGGPPSSPPPPPQPAFPLAPSPMVGTLDPTKWYLGSGEDNGQNCNDVCSVNGGQCELAAFSLGKPISQTGMSIIASHLGVQCESFQAGAGYPVRYKGVCHYSDNKEEAADTCSYSFEGVERFCHCIGVPPEVESGCSPESGQVCLNPTEKTGEFNFNPATAAKWPYQDILDGDKEFETTYPENEYYSVGPFTVPVGPFPEDWTDECIDNMKGVGFLNEPKNLGSDASQADDDANDWTQKVNDECPAGWFLCKGMCYTLVQRNNRGPQWSEQDHPSDSSDFYLQDYMGVEARCGLCGKARVAFVGEDPGFYKVMAEAAEQTLNGDKAVWVRRYRFRDEENELVEDRQINFPEVPYQPWHRYVNMHGDGKQTATYQRFYDGSKDDLDSAQWDQKFRNQEGSILCVNTVERIKKAVAVGKEKSNLSMDGGCVGQNRDNMWDNREHRWFPQDLWPYPGH